MGLTEIKKELKNFDQKRLIDLIGDLYKKYKPVKEYLDFYIYPNEEALFEKYRKKVLEAFYPKRGDRLSLRDGKQAIQEFIKFEPSEKLIADLMLFYVETGVRFTNDWGDMDEAFYSSVERTFYAALSRMRTENLLDSFTKRVEMILADTRDIGWGFHDELADIYYEFYLGRPEDGTDKKG